MHTIMATTKPFKLKQKVTFKTHRGTSGSGKIIDMPEAGKNGAYIHVKADDDGRTVKLRPSQMQHA